jgi:hypothetical protein
LLGEVLLREVKLSALGTGVPFRNYLDLATARDSKERDVDAFEKAVARYLESNAVG